MRFFTSDEHFGSDTIIQKERRPFLNIEAFEDYYISACSTITENDVVYHIGDFFDYAGEANPEKDKNAWRRGLEIIKKLPGKHVLIIGNNEVRLIKGEFSSDIEKFKHFLKENGFEDVHYDLHMTFGDRNFYLNHYPSEAEFETIELFGHVHRATGVWKPFGINVGVDVQGFAPISEEDLLFLLERKEKWWDKDPDIVSLFPNAPYEDRSIVPQRKTPRIPSFSNTSSRTISEQPTKEISDEEYDDPSL